MCRVWLAKRFLTGLLSLVLVFAVSLPFSACDEESAPANQKTIVASNDKTVRQFFKGVVLDVVGDAWLKSLDGAPVRFKAGQKIFEKSKITTESTSSVVLIVADGSVLKVEGKSDVEFDAAMVDSLRRKISVSVRYGKLLFDVQKQAVKDEFAISTDNLTSTVRGTGGFMENVDGLEVTSLKEGRLEVVSKKDSQFVVASGQTLLANANGVKLLSLASSGTLFLAKVIDSLAVETASRIGVHASKISLDSMETMLLNFDEAYKKKVEAFIKKTQSQFKPMGISEHISRPSVSLEALFIPGMVVSVMGIRDTIPENGIYKRVFEWNDSTAYGPKHFVANCGNGDVEYICHTWNTNFVSAKMAEVLTKADERKSSVSSKDTLLQPQKLKLAILVEGSGRERIHVLPEERDVPATLRFSVTGLMGADLKQIKNITVKRKGQVIKVFSDEELTTNSFKLPIRLKQNRIAHFEIVMTLLNGKKIKARKVYETYCYFDNYEDGKKSNRINNMSAEEEYRNVVSKRLLKNE